MHILIMHKNFKNIRHEILRIEYLIVIYRISEENLEKHFK